MRPDVFLKGMDRFEEHLKNYEEHFRKKNKLPKNYDYRPYRWCSRDIVFALIVVRHNRQGNFLESDVCLIANPPQYINSSGARVALGFLLSEAFKCGGSMEIVFTNNVEGGRVPAYICDLAVEMGVKLTHVFEGHISPFEAKQLYLELAGFSKPVKDKIMSLAVEKKISPERACFVVMGGVWTLPEAESIILSAEEPERILASLSCPSDRQIYLGDLTLARMAVLGGILDRKMLKPELRENGEIVESEDEENIVEIGFEPEYFVKTYQAPVVLELPWTNEKLKIIAGEKLYILVRVYTDSEMVRGVNGDVLCLEKLKRKNDRKGKYFLLLPRDFCDLDEGEQQKICKVLNDAGAGLMIAPETVASIDKEAIGRLTTGKVLRL